MKTYFFVDETQGVYHIRYRAEYFDELPFTHLTGGSYNVLKARLFNDTYPNFLRIARNNYGAELMGKTGYMVEFFTEKDKADKLCKELNVRIFNILNKWRERNESISCS